MKYNLPNRPDTADTAHTNQHMLALLRSSLFFAAAAGGTGLAILQLAMVVRCVFEARRCLRFMAF